MEGVRQDVVLFSVLLVLSALLAGCAPRAMVCAEPNVLIGDTCCLDSDSNGVCDTREEVTESVPVIEERTEVVIEDSDVEKFAGTFADTWGRKSYTALHGLFVKDYRMKFSAQEFNFLARRLDAQEEFKSVSVVGVEQDTITYRVLAGGKSFTISSDVDDESGEYRQEPFYLFTDVSPETACGDDESCYMSFAKISGDRNYCDKAGSLKPDCVAEFGVSKTITAKIDDCMSIGEYYGRADCLAQLAVKENDIEPCWQAGYDKQIFECMGEVAAAGEDVDQCPEFVASKGYPGTHIQTAYCIVAYVRETADTDACAKIDRRNDIILGSMQENCYRMIFP
jgi:hypothetical protein